MRQIKQATKSGDPLLHDPQALLESAITQALREKGLDQKVHWLVPGSITHLEFHTHPTTDVAKPKEKGWYAKGSGKAKIGYTRVSDDRFFEPREYNFTLEYISSKDSLGLPDFHVTTATIELNDRAALMNFEDLTLKREEAPVQALEAPAPKPTLSKKPEEAKK